MKKVRFALAGAICLIVLGIAAIVALGWRSSQTVQSKTPATSQSSSTEDRSARPTEPNLQSVTEENIPRVATSEDDLSLKDDKNSKKTNQVPDVTDGKVLRQSLFDFVAILEGDYSSVAGTWQDGYGNIIVIDM